MPLMMCPNCNAAMTEVKRHEVTFDMCPTCRGVWLDRGELEKIISVVQSEQASATPQQQVQQRPQQGYRDRDGYDDRDDGDHYTDKHGRRRRRGGFDMFDFFD